MFGLAPLPRTLAAALRDIESPKLAIRRASLRDLARHAAHADATGRRDAIAAIERALDDPEEGVRADAAIALADANAEGRAERLARVASEDPAPRVRQMALLALGELGAGSSAVLAVVRAALNSENAAERFQALLAMHQLSTADSESAILAAMLDADAEVCRLAFRIARAHWADAPGLPRELEKRAQAIVSDGANEEAVRAAAALVLADFGDLSGESLLLALVARAVPGAGPEDEQAAIELVAELGLTAAVPALRRRGFAFFKDPLAYDARIALARLGDARARLSILRALGAWTFDGRTLAVAAVGRARLYEARDRLVSWLNRPEQADPQAVRDALALLDESPSRA